MHCSTCCGAPAREVQQGGGQGRGGERRGYLRQPMDDESEKGGSLPEVAEQPTQMGVTGPTEDDLPMVTGKPGEFGAGIPMGDNSGGPTETTNLKGDAGRVEKGVLVAVVDAYGLVTGGNRSVADRADNGPLLFWGTVGSGIRWSFDLGRGELDSAQAEFSPWPGWPYCDRR